MFGALIFGALERDFEVQQRHLAVKAKADFLKNRSNMTKEDVRRFVQVRDEEVCIFRVIVTLIVFEIINACFTTMHVVCSCIRLIHVKC